jgi:hypothetical protein
MTGIHPFRALGLVILVAVFLTSPGGAQTRRLPPTSTPPVKFVPKFEALAETPLLMDGLNLANYRSLEKHLKKKPADAETWTFARGQALIIAETGNLLLLRPPRNKGRDTWMKLAMANRDAAGALARQLGAQDYEKSKAAFASLTASCNRCHTTFRAPVRIGPEREAAPGSRADARQPHGFPKE